jgi:hypothetical protein
MSTETHPYQTCRDEHCPLPWCRIYKEAYEVGYQDGFGAGYANGYSAGYGAGYAAGASSCSCG